MIIWKGWGILVVVIVVVCMVVIQGGIGLISGDPNFDKLHHWPFGLALLVSAIPIYFTGLKLNSSPGRVLLDPRTGREVVFRRQHSLFFIPFQYWAFIVGAIGLVVLVSKLISGN